MTRIAYYRVSTVDQSIESQKHAMGGNFDTEFNDEGISGTVEAMARPGFAKMVKAIEASRLLHPDLPVSVHVYAVDRLGRDAIDVQVTVKKLQDMGVSVNVFGLGEIAGEMGNLILAVLAQIAQMEKNRIAARTEAGRKLARETLERTGKTHKGKTSLGAPRKADSEKINQLVKMKSEGKSNKEIEEVTGLSKATINRYFKMIKDKE